MLEICYFYDGLSFVGRIHAEPFSPLVSQNTFVIHDSP